MKCFVEVLSIDNEIAVVKMEEKPGAFRLIFSWPEQTRRYYPN